MNNFYIARLAAMILGLFGYTVDPELISVELIAAVVLVIETIKVIVNSRAPKA